MPVLYATEARISALSQLSTMSKDALATILSGTLHITSIAFLRLESYFSRCCTPLKVRISQTLMPLFESGLLTNGEVVPVTTIT